VVRRLQSSTSRQHKRQSATTHGGHGTRTSGITIATSESEREWSTPLVCQGSAGHCGPPDMSA
jgi:hypothetical protein